MKITLFSDWHLERDGSDAAPLLAGVEDADVCIVPGDIDLGDRAVRLLGENLAPRMHVIYVPGNHCYRGHNHDEMRRSMRAAAKSYPRLHLLDPGAVEIGDVRFIGATLWTDFLSAGPENKDAALAFASNRFGRSTLGEGNERRQWTPLESTFRHAEELSWMDAALSAPWSGRTVVISHHAPHPESVHPRFRANDPVFSGAYVSDLSDFIARHQPELWCHGHTHDSSDYVVGRTRILSNPRGYSVEVSCENGVETIQYPADVVVRAAGHMRSETYAGAENRGYAGSLTVDLPTHSLARVA